MTPHVHVGAVHVGAAVLGTVAVFGTLHLLALTAPNNRVARAWIGLGF